MTVRRSESMVLEAFLRRISGRMGVKLLDPYRNLNTPHDDPVLLQWGSNSIECDRQDLAPLVDAMDDELISANCFLIEVWMPFLREHADKAPQ